MRKITRKSLIKKLDTKVSLIIREREKRCFTCGSDQNLTCGHLFTRGLYIVRWDLRPDGNLHTQCWPCNYKHTWDTAPYQLRYIDKFGLDAYKELYRYAHRPNKFSDRQLKQILENLNDQRPNLSNFSQ